MSGVQVAASFLLVIVGMIYYKTPEDGQVTECGSLLPDWQSVSAIFSFYTIVFVLMVVANIWFIRHTRREAATEVSIWVILTHPALRLILCKLNVITQCSVFSFFLLSKWSKCDIIAIIIRSLVQYVINHNHHKTAKRP